MPELVAYRWADHDTPLWANPNRSPGRWHHPGSEPTKYWALHPLGPWAEYLRAHGIRDHAGLEAIASRTWAARFSLDPAQVATISFANAADWSIEPAELVAEDHCPCQDAAAWLRDRYSAAIVPSAALPGTNNLVLFGARVLAPYDLTPVDVDLDVATAVTSDRGRPPPTLLELACHLGDAHAGLRAWESEGTLLTAPSLRYQTSMR